MYFPFRHFQTLLMILIHFTKIVDVIEAEVKASLAKHLELWGEECGAL